MKCNACGYSNTHSRGEIKNCKLCGAEFAKHTPAGGVARAAAPARVAERRAWERHLLERIGAQPMTLEPGQVYLVGRAPECDLSIPSQRVSRQHAEIAWQDGNAVLRDKSQFGTMVNGAPVKGEHTLKDKDEVVIGPYVMTYRRMAGAGSVGRMNGLIQQAHTTQPMMGETMSGQLSQMPLFEVLTSLELGQRSGKLEVIGNEHTGVVLLDGGRMVHATIEGGGEGEAALLELLGWGEGVFKFGPSQAKLPEPNLPDGLTPLAAEAKRRMKQDEASA